MEFVRPNRVPNSWIYSSGNQCAVPTRPVPGKDTPDGFKLYSIWFWTRLQKINSWFKTWCAFLSTLEEMKAPPDEETLPSKDNSTGFWANLTSRQAAITMGEQAERAGKEPAGSSSENGRINARDIPISPNNCRGSEGLNSNDVLRFALWAQERHQRGIQFKGTIAQGQALDSFGG